MRKCMLSTYPTPQSAVRKLLYNLILSDKIFLLSSFFFLLSSFFFLVSAPLVDTRKSSAKGYTWGFLRSLLALLAWSNEGR